MTLASLPALAQYPHTAEILEVAGRWTGTQAEVVWTTGVEYGTGGFRVYRQSADGEMPLHAGFIPADITRPYGSYAAVDAERREGEAGTYRIEELRGDGTVVSLGVWPVTFRAVVVEPLLRLAHEQQEDTYFGLASEPGPAPAAKLPIARDDIYAVSFASLAPVLGLTPGEVAERAHNAMLAMRHGDEAVAYLVDSAAERILFYGWRTPSTYSRTSYVFVEPGEGLHIERMAPEAIAVSSDLTFRSPRVYEKDLAIMTERGILRDDLYFWQSFVAGHPTVGVRTFDVPLDGYAGGDVDITVHLLGWNDTPMDPDHQADVLLNDDLLGSVFFDGKDEVSASFTVPAATVLPAGNVLTVRAILQSGHTVSFFVLDRFEVTYTRYYEPVNGVLQASDGGHGRLAADQFAAPLVFDVTDRHHPVWIADATGTIPVGHSWVAGAGSEWALRERDAVAIVTPEPGGFGAWLRATTNAIDYLVVTPRAFETPARALSDYRASLGLRTAVALFEDIGDQFADGLRSPESIRSMLAYAHAQWDAAPWMVVLVGWGHYDYLGAMTAIPNPLPPLLASDSATLRPADGRLADLTGNGVPDLAIGRIPAHTVAQLEAYLDKLQDYESGEAQAGLQAMLFAADNADGAGNFTASNIAMGIPAGQRYATAFTTLDSNTVAGVRADIQSALVNGSGIIHYTGHGSYQQLAGENLLHVNDVNAMGKHPPIPLFISLTCLIGRFDMPNTRSLAEALALRAEGGALAVYAPSGLSWNYYAGLFGNEFYRLHAEDRVDTVGLLLLRTRQSFGVLSGLHADAIRTYNLLGDPALKLKGGEGGGPATWITEPAQWRWERFAYAELADPINSLNAVEAWLIRQRGSLFRFQ